MDNLRQRVQDASNVSLQLNYTGALGTSMPNQVWKDIVNIKEATSKDVEKGLKNMSGTLWQCPMKIDGFQLPIDPMIGVDSKNIITRRYVARGSMRGSIKESWSQDDWSVAIEGLLIGTDDNKLIDQVFALRSIFSKAEALTVENYVLNKLFGIERIVVESYAFPHTKGLDNQIYQIKAYSDETYQLLEEI